MDLASNPEIYTPAMSTASTTTLLFSHTHTNPNPPPSRNMLPSTLAYYCACNNTRARLPGEPIPAVPPTLPLVSRGLGRTPPGLLPIACLALHDDPDPSCPNPGTTAPPRPVLHPSWNMRCPTLSGSRTVVASSCMPKLLSFFVTPSLPLSGHSPMRCPPTATAGRRPINAGAYCTTCTPLQLPSSTPIYSHPLTPGGPHPGAQPVSALHGGLERDLHHQNNSTIKTIQKGARILEYGRARTSHMSGWILMLRSCWRRPPNSRLSSKPNLRSPTAGPDQRRLHSRG